MDREVREQYKFEFSSQPTFVQRGQKSRARAVEFESRVRKPFSSVFPVEPISEQDLSQMKQSRVRVVVK